MVKTFNTNGFTIIEVLISFTVTTILGLAIYHFMFGARHTFSLATARATIRQESEILLRHLQKDIASSRAEVVEEDGERLLEKSLKANGSNLTLQIPFGALDGDQTFFDQNTDNKKSLYAEVKYTLEGTKYFREDNKGRKLLSSNVKEIVIEDTYSGMEKIDYSGKVKILIKLAIKPDGASKEVEFVQRAIVSIREAKLKKGAQTWRQNIDSTPGNY